MKHKLSASRLGIARRCVYFARPEVVWPERESSREATLGTVVHSAIERSDESLAAPDYDALDDDQVDVADRLLATWWPWWQKARGGLDWKREVAIAWDVKSGAARILPRVEHRSYGALGDYEVPGTIDALAVDGSVVYVIDWKTGRQQVESPATNPQLAHNGGAAMSAYGVDLSRVTFVKLGEEAIYHAQPYEHDALSIESVRDELAGAIDRIATSEPVPGPWCTWCPARGACPATTEHVAEVVSAASIVRRHPISLEIRDNDHAAGMLSAIDGVESFLSELKKRLRAYADANGGITLPDGTVYARTEVTTERPDLSVDGASDALVNLGLQAAIKLSTTWAEVKKVGGKDAEKRVREALRAMGAVKVSTSPRYEAKAKKGQAA